MNLKRIDTIPAIDVGAPEPLVYFKNSQLKVLFYIDGNEVDDACLMRFNFCKKYSFGYPNSEVLQGHPYYPLGLRMASFYEVEHSDLTDQLMKIARIHPYFDAEKWNTLKHFILTFHDNMLECISKDYSFECVKYSENLLW